MNTDIARQIYDRVLPGWRDGPLVRGNRRIRCPLHRDERHPNLDVHEQEGVWICRAGCGGGGAVELARRVVGAASTISLLRELGSACASARVAQLPPALARPHVAVADLGPPTIQQIHALIAARRLIDATTLAQLGARHVHVWDAEWLGFPTLADEWKLWGLNGDGGQRVTAARKLVRKNVGPASVILSPALRETLLTDRQITAPIWDVEGESDLLALLTRQPDAFALTGTVGAGALAGHERHRQALAVLAPSEVIVVRDLDDAGRRGAAQIAAWWQQRSSTVRVRVLSLPATLGKGGDLRDYLLGRPATAEDSAMEPLGGIVDLEALAANTPAWEPLEDIGEQQSTCSSKNSHADDPPSTKSTGVVLLANVKREQVDWLWRGRIPLGKVTLLEGDPDEGKSTVALDLAARASTGRAMPFDDRERRPAGAVILNAEDGLGDTIRPRLEAAGADLTQILGFQLDQLPDIPEGLSVVEDAIRQINAALVIVDPLMAFLSNRIETHKDHHVRRALAPLTALAQRTGAALLVLRHLNKSSSNTSKYRGGGSIGILGAARSALLAAPDPEDETRKILARVKGNLSAPVRALAYRLIATDDSVRVEWLEETAHTADGLLIRPETSTEPSARDTAGEFLASALAHGPREAQIVQDEARAAGIADRTLDRARNFLGVKSLKGGFHGPWFWSLPDAEPKGATSPGERQSQDLASFGSDSDTATEDRPSGAKLAEGIRH